MAAGPELPGPGLIAKAISLREDIPFLDDSLPLPIDELLEEEGVQELEYPLIDDGFGEEDLVPEELSGGIDLGDKEEAADKEEGSFEEVSFDNLSLEDELEGTDEGKDEGAAPEPIVPSQISRDKGGPTPIAAAGPITIGKLPPGAEGLSTLGKVYDHYRQAWGFPKGAFLLKTGDFFMPWLISGFDDSTSRKLRIPQGALPSSPEGGYLWLKAKEAKALAPYFSVRDFSSLEGLAIRYFPGEEGTQALLIVAEGRDRGFRDESGSESMLGAIAAKILPLVALEESKAGFEEGLTKYASREGKLYMAVLDPRKAVSALKAESPFIDEFRYAHFIAALLKASLGSSSGDCLRTASGKLALILYSARALDEELFLHRIRSLLAGYLPKSALAGLGFESFDEASLPAEGLEALRSRLRDDA